MFDILYSKFCAATEESSVRIATGGTDLRTQRIDKILSPLPLECYDLATSTTDVGINIECFPKMIYGCGARHSPNIEENADVRLENGAKSVEEPSVRVDLLLILLFEAEYDLDWH